MSADRPGTIAYVDASALVKLVLPEAESEALTEVTSSGAELVSSIIAAVEVRRAIRSAGGADELGDRGEDVIASLTMIGVTEEIARRGGALQPTGLRSLDAIHLATALSLGDELAAFIVYDKRLGEAARAAGLPVSEPGAVR